MATARLRKKLPREMSNGQMITWVMLIMTYYAYYRRPIATRGTEAQDLFPLLTACNVYTEELEAEIPMFMDVSGCFFRKKRKMYQAIKARKKIKGKFNSIR